MLKHGKRAENSARWTRRRTISVGVTAAGAAIASIAMAMPAGALAPPSNVTYPAAPANNTLIGSGSSTDYQMMIALDSVFDQVPGCVITSGSVTGAPSKASQELNYSCETNSGGTTLEQVPGTSYLDNPVNDNAVEEPPMGSSNGIAQLELGRNQAGTGVGTAFTSTSPQSVSAINYARSSRDPSGSSDIQGLNFVAYAKDGVAPLIFTETGSVKTPFGHALTATGAQGLTTAELQGIYNGSIYDWGQLPGVKTSAPIFVYSGQEGSGTQATFKTFLGFDPSASTNKVNCADPVKPGTKVITTPSKLNPTPTFEQNVGGTLAPLTPTSTTCLGPDVIFENEDSSILANASSTTEDALATSWTAQQLTPATGSAASPVADMTFFYSFGKFNLQCEGIKEKVSYSDHSSIVPANFKAGTECGSTTLPTGDKLSLTPVNTIAPNTQTIIGGTSVFPIDRLLYNVYSNGSNANIPEATAATLNYVSEVGFLCKPQTVNGAAETVFPTTTFTPDTTANAANDLIDPANGLWFHDEIFNTIVANGFIPVNATDAATTFGTMADGAPIPENAAGATHTAYSLLSATTGGTQYGAAYLGADAPGQTSNTSIPTATNPLGYCIMSTTDANANS
jgi:ABC-type phosphate transport system substrate-binding protein